MGNNTLYFAYDASGTPMSVTYNGTNYYYATDLQDNVKIICPKLRMQYLKNLKHDGLF